MVVGGITACSSTHVLVAATCTVDGAQTIYSLNFRVPSQVPCISRRVCKTVHAFVRMKAKLKEA